MIKPCSFIKMCLIEISLSIKEEITKYQFKITQISYFYFIQVLKYFPTFNFSRCKEDINEKTINKYYLTFCQSIYETKLRFYKSIYYFICPLQLFYLNPCIIPSMSNLGHHNTHGSLKCINYTLSKLLFR